jgi:organic radical activating enzyme
VTDLPIYLETGGHRPEQLAKILPHLDLVGMDFKLPSTSGESYWQEHYEFLKLCTDLNKEVFIKIIISHNTEPTELKQAAELVAGINPSVPVFLQPVTPLEATLEQSKFTVVAPTPYQVLSWQAMMKEFIKDVRVIPQTHKMMNQL